MAGDIDLAKNYQNNVGFNGFSSFVPGSFVPLTNTTGPIPTGFGSKDEKIDWAKFTMWLKGFLSAIEGKPLMPEDVAKIMERLAHVDPDAQQSYQGSGYPYDWLRPTVTPTTSPSSTWIAPNTTYPQWTINDDNKIKLINELYVNAGSQPITATYANEAALNASA